LADTRAGLDNTLC